MSEPSERALTISGLVPVLRTQPWGAAVEGALEKLLSLEQLNELYAQIPAGRSIDQFLDCAIDILKLQYEVAPPGVGSIPRTGRLMIVANHPFGAVEGLILARVLRAVRPDVRFVANFLLTRIPELRELFISVDPFAQADSAARNLAGLRQAREWLEQDGCLVIFPAGEVSHLQLAARTVTDPPWHTTAARLAMHAAAPVLPIYFHGSNSALFHLAGLLQPRLRTAMLPRELLNKSNDPITLAIGQTIEPSRLQHAGSAQDVTDYLRFRTYILASAVDGSAHNQARGSTAPARRLAPIGRETAADILAAELESVTRADPSRRLVQEGELSIYLVDSALAPNTLQEIGRLREITFRAAGEGTGRTRDIDLYDAYYDHLILWNEKTREIAGAYRLARTDVVRRRYGWRGLYTSTLFRYDTGLLDALGPAIELGRSFVRIEYQRSYAALMLLWKGIGQYVVRSGNYHTLFGPVSVSNAYHPLSRALMVEFFSTHHVAEPLTPLVKARRPYLSRTRLHGHLRSRLPAMLDLAELETCIGELESDGKGIPVLLRHYLKLGGRFAGFHLDTSFGHCIDGLIVVDLRSAPPNTLRRYMGKSAAGAFLANHTSDDIQEVNG